MTQAINNIFTIYDPEVIAVNTTCLSETIGDDLGQIIASARDQGLVPEGKEVFHASTPSYRGSHVTGFSAMVEAMARHFATRTGSRSDAVNIIPGYVDPADMREIKRLTGLMKIKTIMFPDTSDRRQSGNHRPWHLRLGGRRRRSRDQVRRPLYRPGPAHRRDWYGPSHRDASGAGCG
jgi:nitrogenase molybdenum-iron protein alpha/beta subunit